MQTYIAYLISDEIGFVVYQLMSDLSENIYSN